MTRHARRDYHYVHALSKNIACSQFHVLRIYLNIPKWNQSPRVIDLVIIVM